MSGRWRGRFSVAVRLSPDGNAGTVVLVRPASAERFDTPFTLLPEAADDAPAPAGTPALAVAGVAGFTEAASGRPAAGPPAVPGPLAGASYEAVRDAFRPLPPARSTGGRSTPRRTALLLLGPGWLAAPCDLPAPIRLNVLRFAAQRDPPVASAEPQSVYTVRPVEARPYSPGLTRYAFDVVSETRARLERTTGPAAPGPAVTPGGADAQGPPAGQPAGVTGVTTDRLTWSVRCGPAADDAARRGGGGARRARPAASRRANHPGPGASTGSWRNGGGTRGWSTPPARSQSAGRSR